jgi:hypothetical protein
MRRIPHIHFGDRNKMFYVDSRQVKGISGLFPCFFSLQGVLGDEVQENGDSDQQVLRVTVQYEFNSDGKVSVEEQKDPLKRITLAALMRINSGDATGVEEHQGQSRLKS